MGKEKLETIPALLADYEKWIRLQGFASHSTFDHRQKLSRFLAFIRTRGVVDGRERVDLARIDQEMIADYQGCLFESVSERTGKKLSTVSQINYLSYLQTFYRFLKSTGRVTTNPTGIIKLPRHPRPLPHVLLTTDEVRRLLAQPDLHNPMGFRDRVMLEVLWATGMRLGELTGLHVEDVRFEEGTLTLRAPKGRKDRSIPVGEGALAWLREYIKNVRPLLVAKRSRTCSLAAGGAA